MWQKVFGTITDKKTKKGVKGLRVEAWDDDFPDGDDFLGDTTTDDSGSYRISYSGGHWDPSISSRATVWRPDIYIRVLIKNASGEWVYLGKSRVHRNHTLPEDLQVDLDVEIEDPIAKETSFRPEVHGFHFPNFFKVQAKVLGVDLGRWNMGFCGGMCAAALHRFKHNGEVPPDTRPPAQGTSLYAELLDRQIKTLLEPNMLLDDIYDWQSAPDESYWYRKRSIGWRTKGEWWKLKDNLDKGKPSILVLIRVEGYFANPTSNHQVLAIGYDYHPTSKDLQIQVYDPNEPDTTQSLFMNVGLPKGRLRGKDSTGSAVRGFFVNPNSDAVSELPYDVG